MAGEPDDIAYDITFLVETSPGSGNADNVTGWFELDKAYDNSPNDPQTEQVDVTVYKSPNRAKQYAAGLTDYGDEVVTMILNEGSATDVFCRAWRASGENRKLRRIFASGVQETIEGFPTGYKRGLPLGDKKTVDLTLKVSGAELQEAAA